MKRLFLYSSFFILSIYTIFAQNLSVFGGKECGINELSSYLINKIVQDSTGFIWIATNYGLNKYDGIKFTYYLSKQNGSLLLGNSIKALMIDKENTLWVGCEKGLQYYDERTDNFGTISFPGKITPYIYDVIELNNGQIWVTTSGDGIFSVNKKTKEAKQEKHITRMVGDYVAYLYQDKQNYLWLAVCNTGLYRINPATYEKKLYHYPEISYNSITSMIEDNAGRLYMSTPSSLSIYDKKNQTFSTITTDDGKILPAIRMIKTKKGYIYVSTNGRGLYYIDYKTNTLKKITYNAASDRYYYYYYTSIPALMEDKDQNLWLGTFKKGILTLQGNPKQFGSLEFSNIKDRSGSVII